jgi:cell wall-associated NlpC family hydrolase
MRRGVWLLVVGVFLAALGAASAYGAGSDTTTAATTTSETTTPVTTTQTTTTAPTTTTTPTTTTSATTTAATTTGTTTKTPAPKRYASLSASYLPAGCVGAGAAAIAEPGSRVLGLGTPASSRGASTYPTKWPIVRFVSSTGSGSSCSAGHVSLGSVSLFGGVISAQSITSAHGRGTVAGFAIYGSPAELSAGDSVSVGGWSQVTFQKTVGRLTAPLVVELTAAHDGLPAGTTIALGFSASAQRVHSASHMHSGRGSAARKNVLEAAKGKKKRKLSIDFPAAPDPFVVHNVLTPVAKHNAVVSTAIRYLGIKYQWGGATPATGFDCSGLVTYVFAKLGVSLPHYTVSQYTSPDGVWVSPKRLEAGDLLFFVGSDGTRKAPGHVGIYVGDGYFIDAPHTGSFVRVDSLKDNKFANQYVGARRIETQLLVSRHLLAAPKPKAIEAAPFLHALSFQASGALPLPTIAAAIPTAEHIPVGRSDTLLLVGGPLGAFFALSAAGAGAFFVRKRRRGDLPEAPLH